MFFVIRSVRLAKKKFMKARALQFSVVCVLISIFVGSVKGQSYVYVSMGLNQNVLKTNISNMDAINSEYVAGFQAGVGYFCEINGWLGYEGQLSYMNKSNRILRNSFFTGIYREIKSNYLQIPVFLRLKVNVNRKTQGYVGFGGFAGYWLNGRLEASYPNVLAPKNFNEEVVYENIYQIVSRHNIREPYRFSDMDNRTEYGTVVGGGIVYHLNDKYGLLCHFRSYASLSDLQKRYQMDQMKKTNSTISMSAGFTIKL